MGKNSYISFFSVFFSYFFFLTGKYALFRLVNVAPRPTTTDCFVSLASRSFELMKPHFFLKGQHSGVRRTLCVSTPYRIRLVAFVKGAREKECVVAAERKKEKNAFTAPYTPQQQPPSERSSHPPAPKHPTSPASTHQTSP